MDDAPLAEAPVEDDLDGADKTGPAVGDDQQRMAKPPVGQAPEEPGPGVVALRTARLEAQEHGLARRGETPGHQHRLGRRSGVHAEVAPVGEEVVDLDARQVPGLPDVELVADGLADAAHRRLRHRRVGPEGVGEAGLHVPHRQAPHEPGDHEGLQGVGASHAGAEQPGRERLAGAPGLRPLQDHLPGGRLDAHRAVAVAGALPLAFTAGVTLPAQELGDLGLQRSLEHQPHRGPGHLLEVFKQAAPLGPGDQLVSISARMVSVGDTRAVTGVGPPS
jgi:hypothetical protein